MLCCVFTIPEETEKPKRKNARVLDYDESTYYTRDAEKLKDMRCPNCKEHALFRGLVYLSCRECMNYFTEKE